MHVEVPLQMINAGGEQALDISRPIACPDCSGSGSQRGTSPRQCASCGGSGQKIVERKGGKAKASISFQHITSCADCRGKGVVIDKPCSNCRGAGQYDKHESLTVKIPAGDVRVVGLSVQPDGKLVVGSR